MDVKLLTQPYLSTGEEFFFGDKIISLLSAKKPKFRSISFMFGLIKANVLPKLEPYIVDFLSNGGIINFYIDLDKKINSKPIMSELLALGCNIYIFSPKDSLAEFQYRGVIFETSKKAEILLSSGNFSLNGLYDSLITVTSLSYDLSSDDKNLYKEFKENLFPVSLLSKFSQIFSDTVDEAYIKNNFIPSVEDFTNKDVVKPKLSGISDSNILIEIDDAIDFTVPVDTPKVEKKPELKSKEPVPDNFETLPSSSLQQVTSYSGETIYYGADDVVDVENLLFNNSSKHSSSKKADVVNIDKQPVVKDIIDSEEKISLNHVITKPVDISKTAIFMFQAPKITAKGICKGEVKIPLYLRDLTAAFWEWPHSYECLSEHSKVKSRTCTFRIIDTKNSSKEVSDKSVRLFQREAESSFSIFSKELELLNIQENDIIRLIKTQEASGSYYMCEIIRQDAKEYNIWEQFCTHTLKNGKRKYGIM